MDNPFAHFVASLCLVACASGTGSPPVGYDDPAATDEFACGFDSDRPNIRGPLNKVTERSCGPAVPATTSTATPRQPETAGQGDTKTSQAGGSSSTTSLPADCTKVLDCCKEQGGDAGAACQNIEDTWKASPPTAALCADALKSYPGCK